ncbi:MAG TPA: glycoside hydrolase family 172 protein [Limnochordia bacterium]|nr:glycoside hydrolase family 172 protein [Limnochordia bacterium]
MFNLNELATLKPGATHRASSYDTTGGNRDNWRFEPGETRTLAALDGAGTIRHIWVTISSAEPFYLRKLVLRMYWDGSTEPSVECPIGDFFGLGHGIVHSFVSAPLQMWNRAFNCWFPMPFADGAKVTLENQGEQAATVYFYIDYERHERRDDQARFHAQWRRRLVTLSDDPEVVTADNRTVRVNTTGANNYVVLEATGRGHYVGCHLDLDTNETGWWGEGDDMFVIDGEAWPPRLHGTGTEDYFCGAWNYNNLAETFCTPYYGYHFKGNNDYTGKHSQYRYHILDPIRFERSLRFSIEHGHANDRSGDWSSVAYWYQTLPAAKFPTLLPVEERIPYRFGGIENLRAGRDRRDLPVHRA